MIMSAFAPMSLQRSTADFSRTERWSNLLRRRANDSRSSSVPSNLFVPKDAATETFFLSSWTKSRA